MREEYTSACSNTEETHRDWCVCVCVCCAQDVQTHLHNIYTCTHASGCVNQHEPEGMFMYSV